MKTHKTILLLLLLVFAGSFSGMAQTDTLKPGLPDEEVIWLRAELVDELEKDNFNVAERIKDTLRCRQQKDWECLSFKEYFAILFLTGEYDEILPWFNYSMNLLDEKTRYPDIYHTLNMKLRERNPEIQQELLESYQERELEILKLFLDCLKDSSENNPEIMIYAQYLRERANSNLSVSPDVYAKRHTSKDKRRISRELKSQPSKSIYAGSGIQYFIMNGSSYKDLNTQHAYNIVFGFSYWYLYSSIEFSLPSRSQTVSEVQFNGETIAGNFYGIFSGVLLKAGLIINQKHRVRFIPNIFYSSYNYTFFCQKIKLYHYSNMDYVAPIDKFDTTNYGAGLIMAIRIAGQKSNFCTLDLRLGYNYHKSNQNNSTGFDSMHEAFLSLIVSIDL